jgi:penicillin G amidase
VQISRMVFRSLGRRLPVTEGELSLEGLHAPVTIRRDAYGVPYIDAGSDYDAWFGIGFCHGQDRAFQLEMMLRSVRGTLSEVVGPDGLAVDRLSRRVGFRRAADEHFACFDDDVRLMLVAYADGVNAGREHGSTRRPHEFTILRMSPSQWEPADALGYLKLMSMVMSTNWAEELARYQILIRDGIEALDVLEPGNSDSHSVTNPPGATAVAHTVELMDEAREVLRELGIDAGGSNGWVLNGSRTQSGRPILANDTHLSATLPTHFYLAHVRTPEWGQVGASFVGSPGFFLGHNGHAAWGITISGADNTDLFLEDIGPDGASVREGDEWVACEVREEHIRVKGADDLIERVLITPRGPIVGPALDGRPTAISMSAVWLQNHPFRTVFQAHRWNSFEDFDEATNHHPNVALNILYADETGDIGWKLAGNLPVRSGTGALPLPASDPDNHWESDLRPPDDRLRIRNPDAGYIASANNRPIPDSEDAGIGIDFQEGFRITRIDELLTSRDDWEPQDMWMLQLDDVSLPWRELKPVIEATQPVDDDSRVAQLMLLRWDGHVAPASTSASLFETFVTTLIKKVVERAAPVSYTWALGDGGVRGFSGNMFGVIRMNQVIRLATEQPRGWFDSGWNSVIANSMGDGLRMLRFRHGYHTRRWNWGRVRPLEIRHRAGIGPLAPVFNRGPYAIPGDAYTVHAAGVNYLEPLDKGVRSIATARTVIEIGDWDNAGFVLLGGQSGNPMSPHYDDQIQTWLQGRGITIPWSPTAVEEVVEKTLILNPASV